jgi:putative sigma-54 modulation protein
MKFTFLGKNYNISDALKERTRQKLSKLERLFSFETDVSVKYSNHRQDHKIEVTIPLKGRILRAETVATDAYSALDKVIDILEKQTVKYKTRLRDRYRRDVSYKDEMESLTLGNGEYNDDTPVVIDRTKHFPIKPMDAEEAVMEMEMLDHTFYVFRNGQTDMVNVVYKRENGTYGLIQPEY